MLHSPQATDDEERRNTRATLSAVTPTSPIGAMRSAHDHQNHSDPSSAGAAYTFSESCVVARLTTRTHGGPPPCMTMVMKPRLDRSAPSASRPFAAPSTVRVSLKVIPLFPFRFIRPPVKSLRFPLFQLRDQPDAEGGTSKQREGTSRDVFWYRRRCTRF